MTLHFPLDRIAYIFGEINNLVLTIWLDHTFIHSFLQVAGGMEFQFYGHHFGN